MQRIILSHVNFLYVHYDVMMADSKQVVCVLYLRLECGVCMCICCKMQLVPPVKHYLCCCCCSVVLSVMWMTSSVEKAWSSRWVSITFIYLLLRLLSPPSEWRRYCFRSMSVCLCVRSGPVNQTSLKWLKLRTSDLTCIFAGTVRTWPLENFSKSGRVQDHVTPKFLDVNC